MARFVALALLILSAALSLSALAVSPARVTAADLADGYYRVEGWRHRLGHDPSWAAPGLDDADWQQGQTVMPHGQPDASDGHMWFRTTLEFADDVPLRQALRLRCITECDLTTKGVGVGAGLGLAICHQVITDHGGTIRVDSTPGEGSTFTIALPV